MISKLYFFCYAILLRLSTGRYALVNVDPVTLSNVRTCAEARDFKTAEHLCRKGIALSAKRADLYTMLGYVCQQTGRYREAIKISSQAIALFSGEWLNHFTIGLSYLALDEPGAAVPALIDGHALFPAHDDTVFYLLQALERTQETAKMTDIYQRLCESVVPSSRLATAYVTSMFAFGQVETAGKEIVRAGLDLTIHSLCSVPAWAEKHGHVLHAAGDVEAIPYTDTPPLLSKKGYSAASEPRVVPSNRPYIAELADITVISKSSLLITSDGFALNDVATHPAYGRYVSLQYDKTVVARHDDVLLTRHAGYAVRELDRGIFLSGLASDAFGHWLPEFLAKLQCFEHHPDFAALPVIVDDEMPQSHFDYLRYVIPNPLVRIPAHAGLKCRRLLVAPTTIFFPTELVENHQVPHHEIPISVRTLQYLRDRVLPKIHGNSRFGRYIYLSRRDMRWRRLSNDAEISLFLEKQGFDIVFPETLSLLEQALMFRDAERIVAPNGSALLNAIFCKPGTQLFVLSQPAMFNAGGYYSSLHAMGYELLFVVGDTDHAGKHADYSVPLARLRHALSTRRQPS